MEWMDVLSHPAFELTLYKTKSIIKAKALKVAFFDVIKINKMQLILIT